jgi:hypothetical protein
MKALYRAYCRSTASAQCAPYVMLAAVIIMAVVIIGVRAAVTEHFAGLIMAGRDAAAAVCCGLAAVTGIRICRAVAAARGTHYSYRVTTVPEPGRLVIGEHADGTPASVPVPARPGEPAVGFRPRPAEQVPGKSDLVSQWAAQDEAAGLIERDGDRVRWAGDVPPLTETGADQAPEPLLHRAARGAAATPADAAEMAAHADALRDGDLDFVVTERGNLFELDQAETDAP